MTDKKRLDLSKAKRAPAFSKPAPAKAPIGLTGDLPLPPGEPMVLKKVSPGERAVLEKFGWKDGDPVPTNLADVIAEANFDAKNLESMPPPVDLKTPPLKQPKEVKIEDLPADTRKMYETIMESLSDAKVKQLAKEELASAMVSEADPSINEAIKAASGVGGIELNIENDVETETEQVDEEVSAENKSEESEVTFCEHCGWPQGLEDPTEVSETDKLNFLQTLLGLQPFQKTYSEYGGRIEITVRSMAPEDLDACYRQLMDDKANNTIKSSVEEAEYLARYRTAIQLISVIGVGGLHVAFPETLSEWRALVGSKDTLSKAWEYIKSSLNHSETMHRLLLSTVNRFQQLLMKLEANSDNPDFWEAID